ncbi:hypothetical protein [uncultured Friedmanniella sp.]|uniref:hypothetical protein n=1 Tax=uncultured Friedmanniella sp. TaxID=335381 RepID=UPI0035CBBDAE
MGFYASRPARLVSQLLGDLGVVVWAVVWALLGVVVDATVSRLAGPVRDTAGTAQKLSGNLSDAAGTAAQVPGLGDRLRQPFDAASGSLGELVATANRQADSIERLAALLGWLVFLIPVTVVLAFWLPRRIRFFRRARAAQAFLDSTADLDLFALRALALQPLPVLAQISDDPVAAWRRGDRTVINALAAVELDRNGLRLPPELATPA